MIKASFDYLVKEPSVIKKDNKVILMFHGYGSNKEDLFSFSEYMDPSFLIISIQASNKMDYNSYCWWSLEYDAEMNLTMDIEEAKNSINDLNHFISDYLCNKFNFTNSQIYLCGFSQGCMISYALSINFYDKYTKVIGLSGKLPIEIINFKDFANYKEHNFFCSHGIFDQVIPIEIGRKSSEMMSKYGINHKFLEFQSSHGICPENFEQMILWLENN
tara:strand:- start:1212 stop:1862 length:651 start_codon:yes stop_codon:yes gene_type:complete